MVTTTGIVTSVRFDREIGELGIREEFSGALKTLHLYADTDVQMIDPTELVRRNWMFGLLQQALIHGLCVSLVNSDDAFVQGVTLQPRFVGASTTDTAEGMVLEISLLPAKGTVTIRVPNPKFAPQPTPGGPPASFDQVFYIYLDVVVEGISIGDGLVESAHRDRVIRVLQQALADGLPVTLELRQGAEAFVVGVILHRKE
jgi:hypothetical protein